MFKDDFSEYLTARDNGSDATSICKLAEINGLDYFARLRMLRSVFNLTIEGAKAVSLDKTIEGLGQDQEQLLPAIEIALRKVVSEGSLDQ